MSGDLHERILSNTVSQIAGRALIALLRLGVAAIIIRGFGAETFGAFAIILGVLTIAEWIVDFGTIGIFIRDLPRDAAGRERKLRTLTAMMLVQVPAAAAVFLAILGAMRYPASILQAGAIAAISLPFLGGVVVYFAVFRADLRMERAIGAELLSVLALAALLLLIPEGARSLTTVAAAYAVARAVQFAASVVLGWSEYRLSVAGASADEVRRGLRASATAGVIGTLAMAYEATDTLVLSRLATVTEVALYNAAQRLLTPVLLTAAAVAATLYAVAAPHWPESPRAFSGAGQRGLDTAAVTGGLALSAILAGGPFLLALLGPEVRAAAPLLVPLGFYIFLRAMTATIGPLTYIVHAERRTLLAVAISTALKPLVLGVTLMNADLISMAWAAAVVELAGMVIPAAAILRGHGVPLRWSVPLRAAALLAATTLAVEWTGWSGITAMAAAALLYAALSFVTRTISIVDLRLLFRR
jgi:O-antigen/teichoic acid export membrane protein